MNSGLRRVTSQRRDMSTVVLVSRGRTESSWSLPCTERGKTAHGHAAHDITLNSTSQPSVDFTRILSKVTYMYMCTKRTRLHLKSSNLLRQQTMHPADPRLPMMAAKPPLYQITPQLAYLPLAMVNHTQRSF